MSEEQEEVRRLAIKKRKGVVLMKDNDPAIIMAAFDSAAEEWVKRPDDDAKLAEFMYVNDEHRAAFREGFTSVFQRPPVEVLLPIPTAVARRMAARRTVGTLANGNIDLANVQYPFLMDHDRMFRRATLFGSGLLKKVLGKLVTEPSKYMSKPPFHVTPIVADSMLSSPAVEFLSRHLPVSGRFVSDPSGIIDRVVAKSKEEFLGNVDVSSGGYHVGMMIAAVILRTRCRAGDATGAEGWVSDARAREGMLARPHLYINPVLLAAILKVWAQVNDTRKAFPSSARLTAEGITTDFVNTTAGGWRFSS